MCLFPSQLVHDKELAAEDEQVFLMKQQVRKPGGQGKGLLTSAMPVPWGEVAGIRDLAAPKWL